MRPSSGLRFRPDWPGCEMHVCRVGLECRDGGRDGRGARVCCCWDSLPQGAGTATSGRDSPFLPLPPPAWPAPRSHVQALVAGCSAGVSLHARLEIAAWWPGPDPWLSLSPVAFAPLRAVNARFWPAALALGRSNFSPGLSLPYERNTTPHFSPPPVQHASFSSAVPPLLVSRGLFLLFPTPLASPV